MRQTRQTIRKRVSELLKDNGVVRSPVPVERIAQNLRIEVRFEAAEEDLSGALIREPKGRVVIGVNSAHHPNRQRFTIAHEIGHFILHKGMNLHVDEDFRINLRDGSTNDEEIDANAFAAELLMPTAFIGRDIQKLGPIDQQALEKLARRYQVSSRAMEIRLTNLGLKTPL
jgi:Zn-dependent peptidase ImmA (M78 family)